MSIYYKGERIAGSTDGKSAYEIAVENGFVGTEQEWLESLKGTQVDLSDYYTKQEVVNLIPPELTQGDGITLENDTINVTTPVQTILTQAEFDALPEGQRNKGLYVISDGGSGGSGSASTGVVYSIEETVIGTWIDGKPLYRRVLNTTTGSYPTDSTIANVSTWDLDTVVNIYAIVENSAELNNSKYPSGFWMSSNNQVSVYIYTNNLKCLHTNNDLNSQTLVVILEYTKITDSASSDIDIYSTNEIVTGKWINGKNVYTKVIVDTTGNSGTSKQITDVGNLHIDTLVSLKAVMQSYSNITTSTSKYPAGFLYNTSNFMSVYVEDNKLMEYHQTSGYNSQPITFILEYTKTTD